MKAILIHGFNVRDNGAHTIDRLRPNLEARGYSVRDFDYGYFGLARVRFCNAGLALLLSDMLDPDTLVFAHSNGAAILYEAGRVEGVMFRHATLINPALDSKKAIEGAFSVNVWYSPTDIATLASRVLLRHPWGSQGRDGYTGRDARYQQYNSDVIFQDQIGHSGIFSVRARIREVIRRAEERIAGG